MTLPELKRREVAGGLMRFPLAIATLCLLAACNNIEPKMNSWVGRHVDKLVLAWGPPAASHKMADGRTALAWSASEFAHVAGPGIPVPFSANYWCEVTYIADPAGIIVSADFSGNLGGCNALARRKRAAPPKE
ncbi:MAG: hypothetical protein O7G83_01365 [Proteobacteria bacterium]|nr:hypothetical protein [Pseudomonadota bacterium]